jgi:thiol-disulfide isomerase/thioredoxin
MMIRPWLAVFFLTGLPAGAFAERVQVDSIQDEYPSGADFAILTHDGSKVGPLAKHRVPGKFTVFDVYADWCGPCRIVDAHLREIVSRRSDVAVRKLNVVDFESPLAVELGPFLNELPTVVVFSPEGKRTNVKGAADLAKIDKALQPK